MYNVVYVLPAGCPGELADAVKSLPTLAGGDDVCENCRRLGVSAELYAGGRVPRMYVYPSGEWRPANRYEMTAGKFM